MALRIEEGLAWDVDSSLTAGIWTGLFWDGGGFQIEV